jgi:hypothetical protein
MCGKAPLSRIVDIGLWRLCRRSGSASRSVCRKSGAFPHIDGQSPKKAFDKSGARSSSKGFHQLQNSLMPLPASTRLLKAIVLPALMLTLWGCRKPEMVTEISRGRLRCIGLVERRRVNNYWWEVFVDGKPFIIPGADSNKVGQCQASNNPEARALVLLSGDNCWVLRLDGEKAVIQALEKPDGLDAIQQYKTAEFSCGGRCLVWPTQMILLDTNETRKFARLPSSFIGISPDLRTAVTEGRNDPERDQISINLVDLKTGTVTERLLTRENHLWLLDYTARVEGIAARFKWERDAGGKDQLVYPAEEKPKGKH